MDNHSTTPVDPRVLDAMLPYYREDFGNAASRTHAFGASARQAVEEARAKIARLIGASEPGEIIFTSGATESNNLALKGLAEMYREKGNHIITSAIEHKSVLDTCKFLETIGFRVTYLSVNREGLIDLEALFQHTIVDEAILISIMYANNEIGVIQPVAEISAIARERGVFFHCDAVQAAGKVPLNVQTINMDLVSLSAHKIYGPKGVGALYVRKRNPRVRLTPLIHGGGHEQGLRSGTLNVAGIVGFGRAAEIAASEMASEADRLLRLREKLREGIALKLPHVYVNGSLTHRLSGNLNLSFGFVEGASLLTELAREIAVSSGSACTSANPEPSYVLKALEIPEGLQHTSIRFGLGRFNTEEEVEYTIKRVAEIVKKLRTTSPLYTSVEKSG